MWPSLGHCHQKYPKLYQKLGQKINELSNDFAYNRLKENCFEKMADVLPGSPKSISQIV